MQPYFKNDYVMLFCGDCREVLRSLNADEFSCDLLLTDPPYSRVKPDEWDRISHNDLAGLLETVFDLCIPMMKFNAALYCFCWPRFSYRLDSLIQKKFTLLGSIVWCKRRPDGKLNGMGCRADVTALRMPFSETERITFAEMKNADNVAGFSVMSPLIDYFCDAKRTSGISSKEIQERMEILTGKRYVFDRHSFSASQWELPTREQYEAARTFLPLRREYEELRREYEELRREYRPTSENFTDLWFYQPVLPGAKDRIHNCQKPLPMLRDMVRTSCRPGGLVLDPFAGSCATGVAAIQTGRRALLIEKDEKNCEKAARWLSVSVALPEFCDPDSAKSPKSNQKNWTQQAFDF